MKTFWNKLTESGVQYAQDHSEKRSVFLSNYITIILYFVIFIIFLVRFFFFTSHRNTMQFELFSLSVLFWIPIIINHFGFINLGRLLVCYLPVFFIWIIFLSGLGKAIIFQHSLIDGIRLYLLATSTVPFLVMNLYKRNSFFISIAPSFISLVFCDQIIEFFYPEKYLMMVVGNDYQLMQFRTLMSYVIINSILVALHTIIIRIDRLNADLINKLHHQNDLLTEQQNKLNEVNAVLENKIEERTNKIKTQNQLILNYAFATAHQIRGPIARLLGLIGISKIDQNESKEFYLGKIENETTELDKIVKDLSKELYEIPVEEDKNNTSS